MLADLHFKNAKDSSLGKRKILDGNLDAHEGMKSTRNSRRMSKYKRHVSHFKYFFKRHLLLKQTHTHKPKVLWGS